MNSGGSGAGWPNEKAAITWVRPDNAGRGGAISSRVACTKCMHWQLQVRSAQQSWPHSPGCVPGARASLRLSFSWASVPVSVPEPWSHGLEGFDSGEAASATVSGVSPCRGGITEAARALPIPLRIRQKARSRRKATRDMQKRLRDPQGCGVNSDCTKIPNPHQTLPFRPTSLIGSTRRLPVPSGTPMQHLRRHRRLLHIALLVMVALGVLLQPVLGALGDLHALEHAAAMQSHDHGHSHLAGHEAPHDGEDALGDPIGDHGLLHQGGFAMSMALIEPVFQLLPPILMDERLDRSHAPGPPITRLTLPFRPPIA